VEALARMGRFDGLEVILAATGSKIAAIRAQAGMARGSVGGAAILGQTGLKMGMK